MNMHGVSLLLTPLARPSLFPTSALNIFFQNRLKSSNPTCGYCHGITFQPGFLQRDGIAPGIFSWRSRYGGSWKKKSTHLRATRKESPFDVLGVSPSATPQEIKRAYRKLALKFHPDVNKEANAQEKFMRIKHAYNTLLNSESQRKYDFSNWTSGYSNSTSESNSSQSEEDFYGFGHFLRDAQITIEDFFRDLQSEFRNWEANASSQGKPKSLWEELAEIGEEFVEFLEKELNITDSNTGEENVDKSFDKTRSGRNGDNVRAKESSIEENIDDIEAALAQLKRELGL